MKLAFEDINKKLVDVVSVADVDALECVNDSLVDILRLMLSQDFEPEYLSRYWKWSFVKILEQIFVKTLKLNVGQDFVCRSLDILISNPIFVKILMLKFFRNF